MRSVRKRKSRVDPTKGSQRGEKRVSDGTTKLQVLGRANSGVKKGLQKEKKEKQKHEEFKKSRGEESEGGVIHGVKISQVAHAKKTESTGGIDMTQSGHKGRNCGFSREGGGGGKKTSIAGRFELTVTYHLKANCKGVGMSGRKNRSNVENQGSRNYRRGPRGVSELKKGASREGGKGRAGGVHGKKKGGEASSVAGSFMMGTAGRKRHGSAE